MWSRLTCRLYARGVTTLDAFVAPEGKARGLFVRRRSADSAAVVAIADREADLLGWEPDRRGRPLVGDVGGAFVPLEADALLRPPDYGTAWSVEEVVAIVERQLDTYLDGAEPEVGAEDVAAAGAADEEAEELVEAEQGLRRRSAVTRSPEDRVASRPIGADVSAVPRRAQQDGIGADACQRAHTRWQARLATRRERETGQEEETPTHLGKLVPSRP